ncbi:hypothetical protein NUACC21_03850 [Scytonema sp. NUACC21]
MSGPPLRLRDNFDSYIGGEVIIHPSAVIAPGVILQAAPNSKIIIGPGVCIGMGSILQVHEGTLEIQAGANLGAGSLMVGQGTIGANACIGAATTIFNCSVGSGQVIPPGSVLGDTSRQTISAELIDEIEQPQPSTGNFRLRNPESNNGIAGQGNQETRVEQSRAQVSPQSQFAETPKPPVGETVPKREETPSPESPVPTPQPEEPSTESSGSVGSYIYGQESIQRLMITLFPHKKNP